MGDSKDPKKPEKEISSESEDKTVVNKRQSDGTVLYQNPYGRPAQESSDVQTANGFQKQGVSGIDSGNTSGTGMTGTGSDWGQPELWAGGHSPRIEIGVTIKDRFVLEMLLGEGGMGSVYKALDQRKQEAGDRNPYVAIKIISEAFSHHPQSLKALQRESRKIQNLPHKNIVTVYDFDRHGNRAFMTMEILEGYSLREIIKANNRGLSPARARDIIVGLCEALAFAHANNIVHSDLKPGNVFLTRDNIVKVFDFGIARAAKESTAGDGEKTLFDAGDLGALTPAYASLEMLEGKIPSIQDDIYALGCIVYELYVGNHPFYKTKATDARKKGLKPKRIKVLNRRQWKGLQCSLAFEKEKRTPSTEAFLKEITAKKSKIPLFLAIVLVLIIITGALVREPVKEYYSGLKEGKLTSQYIEDIQAGDDRLIDQMIYRISELGIENRRRITDDTREELYGYFERQVNMYFDPSRRRFEYSKAQDVLKLAKSYYEDSYLLSALEEELETSRNNLLSSLTSRFNTYLVQGKILPDKNEEDVFNIMSKVAFIAPDNSMLSDKRLESAYVKEIEKAITSDDLKKARLLVVSGSSLFKDNKALMNLKGKLDNVLNTQKRMSNIVSLENSLKGLKDAPLEKMNVEEFERQVRFLRELQPGHPLISRIEKETRDKVEKALKSIVQSGDWAEGEELLVSMDGILNDAKREDLKAMFEKNRANFEIRVNQLLDRLNQAIVENRLSSPPKGSAIVLVVQLEKIIPDDIRVQRAHTRIAKAYLGIAKKAQSNFEWKKAREYVEKAKKQKINESMLKSIITAGEMIAQAQEDHRKRLLAQEEENGKKELEALQKEKEKKDRAKKKLILALSVDFKQALSDMQMNEKSAGRLLNIIDNLSVISPENPLLLSGRNQIADRFLEHAQGLETAGELEDALTTVRKGLRVIPKNQSLSAVREKLEVKIEKQKLKKKQDTREQYFLDAEKLISRADLTDDWLSKMQTLLSKVRSIDPDNERLQEIETRVTTLILSKAALKREQDLFAEGRRLLEATARFDKIHSGINEERRLLNEAEKDFTEKFRKEAKAAEIEGLKQTLLTRAQANEVEKAKNLFAKLEKDLPTKDLFLVRRAPGAIGDAYLRLARKRAVKNDIAGAINFVKTGLNFNSGHAPLKKELKRLENIMAKVRTADLEKSKQALLTMAGNNDINGAQKLLENLNTTLSPEDPFLNETAPGVIVEAYLRMADSLAIKKDFAGALNTIKTGLGFRAADPGLSAALLKYQRKLSKPRGKECTQKLAGYGRKSRAVCYDMISEERKGPALVVIPGSGSLKSFCIGKYEISIGEFNELRRAKGNADIIPGNRKLPVTGISLEEAKAYAAWLSSLTGKSYRLPTDEEWKFSARSTGDTKKGDYNCRLLMGDKVIKGQFLVGARVGGQNNWGVKNHIGNVREWTVTSSGLKVHGGSYMDTMSKCDVSLAQDHSGKADDITGFRVVRGLD